MAKRRSGEAATTAAGGMPSRRLVSTPMDRRRGAPHAGIQPAPSTTPHRERARVCNRHESGLATKRSTTMRASRGIGAIARDQPPAQAAAECAQRLPDPRRPDAVGP